MKGIALAVAGLLLLAWTAGTDGVITGEPMMAVIRTDADMEKFKGKLRGKIILSETPKEVEFQTKALGHRYTDEELAQQGLAPEPGARPAFGPRSPAAGDEQPRVIDQPRVRMSRAPRPAG